MTRIAARKRSSTEEVTRGKRLRVIFIASLLAISLCCGVFILGQHLYMNGWLPFNREISTNWFTSNIPTTNQTKGIKLAQTNEIVPEPIHFEFYSTLPNMQMKDPVALTKIQPKLAEKASPKPETPHHLAFKPEDIEKEFSKELQVKNYILQLGVFSNFASAEKYRDMLKKAGIHTLVVKIRGRQTAYRLQHGPFQDMAHAKAVQKKLQLRGVKSIVRKLA